MTVYVYLSYKNHRHHIGRWSVINWYKCRDIFDIDDIAGLSHKETIEYLLFRIQWLEQQGYTTNETDEPGDVWFGISKSKDLSNLKIPENDYIKKCSLLSVLYLFLDEFYTFMEEYPDLDTDKCYIRIQDTCYRHTFNHDIIQKKIYNINADIGSYSIQKLLLSTSIPLELHHTILSYIL